MLRCPSRSNPTNLASALHWQFVQRCPTLLDPLLVHQLLPFGVVQPVHQPDGTFTYTRDRADVPGRPFFSEKVGGEVDGTSCDGNGASPIRDTEVAGRSDDVTADWLDVWREIEVVTVTAKEVFRASGGVRVVVAAGGCTGGEVESLFEGFVTLSEGLFRHLRKFTDLPETTGDVGLTTGDKDASGNDSFHRLSSKEFLLIGALVDLLRYIADRLRERKLLAHGGDVSKGGEYVSFRS
jgi:hypothetical protein